jgi:hypothetical protein
MVAELQKCATHKLLQAERYRSEAKRVTTQAEQLSNPRSKHALIDIAHEYEHLAESVNRSPLI